MNNKILLLTLGLSALAFTGCSKSDQAEAKSDIKDAYQDTKAAVSGAWSDFKDYSYEKRQDFSDRANALSAKFDAEVSEVKASHAGAKASASREAAWNKVRDARADFGMKMSALGNATADTWDSAKAEVNAAWDNLQAAYAEAKADAS